MSLILQPPRRTRDRHRCANADPEAAGVLARVRRTQDEVRSGEVRILEEAVEWARLHEAEPGEGGEATWEGTPIPLAGEGAPLVAEFCLAEFSAAAGMKPEAGRYYLAHALELAHRLPQTYAQILAGAVPVWRARRIAEKTLHLSPEAAAYVDAEVAPVADKIGPVVTERLVDEAIARFMPEHALDLDEAAARGAAYLKEQGSTDSLDVRRAQALGNLARGEQQRPETVLYVHHRPEDAHAIIENGGTSLISAEQVKTWCDDSEKVTIKPVIDLAEETTSVGYQPSDRLREQVVLRDRTCVHPYCNRPARNADVDHIEQYPGGVTTSSNLAALCRFHHRLKTHGGWSYTAIAPGTYLWRSPYGYQYLRDSDGGTTDLTPRPVEPPGG